MVYEIVLNNGNVLKCFTKNYDEVLRMIIQHDIFIVQENGQSEKVTYIMPEKVSHFRFPKSNSNTAEPV